MNSNQNNLFLRGRNSDGIAITELAIVLPVSMILLYGIVKMSADFHFGLKHRTLRLEEPLSIHQIPEKMRSFSRWPPLLARQDKVSQYNTNSKGIVAGNLTSTGPVPLLPLALLITPISHLKHKPAFRERWDTLRLRKLSILRTACIAEGSTKVGPQIATSLLLSINATPVERTRQSLTYGLCPWVARGSQTARGAALITSPIDELQFN